MTIKRCHYENAFEAYLARRGIAYVPIEEVRHVAKSQAGLKLFDYIVYPSDARACLVDVKGRKSDGVAKDGEPRQKTWVTRGDIEGLTRWGDVFGDDYVPAFVFAYWLAGAGSETHELIDTGRYFAFAGRTYSFWLVPLDDYVRFQKRLSIRWDTVSVGREAFREISRCLDAAWPAAPC